MATRVRLSGLTTQQRLSVEDLDALRAIRHGGDVTSYTLARRLREIERRRPELLTIGPLGGRYDACGVLPYFGAILTTKGQKVIRG